MQAGVKLKAAVFATGYDPSVVNSPVWSSLQGDEFLSIYRPFSVPDAGTEQMAAALQKYQHFSKTQFPTLFQYETWAGADLMIRGLQMAGANPTRAAVIKELRSIKGYTANGLLPKPIDYSTNFGHDPAEQCVWVLRAEKSGFVPYSSQACLRNGYQGNLVRPLTKPASPANAKDPRSPWWRCLQRAHGRRGPVARGAEAGLSQRREESDSFHQPTRSFSEW